MRRKSCHSALPILCCCSVVTAWGKKNTLRRTLLLFFCLVVFLLFLSSRELTFWTLPCQSCLCFRVPWNAPSCLLSCACVWNMWKPQRETQSLVSRALARYKKCLFIKLKKSSCHFSVCPLPLSCVTSQQREEGTHLRWLDWSQSHFKASWGTFSWDLLLTTTTKKDCRVLFRLFFLTLDSQDFWKTLRENPTNHLVLCRS